MLQARCFQASIHVYMKPEKSLRTRAMEILSRREISRAELKRKLAPYADGEEEIEKVLAEFAERQWQSDARYAEAYVHSKSRQHGALRLKQALLAKGVADELIQPLLPAPDAERQAAIAVLRKNSNNRPPIWPVSKSRCVFSLIAASIWKLSMPPSKAIGQKRRKNDASKPRSPTTKQAV